MSKFLIQLDWNDAPHLSETAKAEMLASTPEYQRDARSKGIPQLGSGAIYPIPRSEIEVKDFAVPEFWERYYGMDVGWNATAVVWFARNPDTDERYITSVYKMGKEKPVVHASAIKARGVWIKGAIDPASRGRSQSDGTQLFQVYTDEGLKLCYADNAVESGIYRVWQLFANGQLKVFSSCIAFWEEFSLYRRDEKGKVVKSNDHVMDAMRYGISTEVQISDVPVERKRKEKDEFAGFSFGSKTSTGWMGRA